MKSYFLAIVLFAISFGATAQMYSTRLWEVSHPNLKYKSYLVGTVHSGDETLFNINDSIYWAIEQSDLVAFEVVEDENTSIYSGLMTMVNSANRDIGFLTMECVMDLMPQFKDTNMDTLVERFLGGMKKLYKTDVRNARGSAYRSMVFDDFLTSYARFKGKDVDGIENVEDQIKTLYTFTKPQMRAVVEGYFGMKKNLMNSFPDDTVVRMAAENRYAEMCDMYSSFSQDSIWGSYFIKLLDNRNVQMADYVKEHSKVEPMMCAVGLAHMCGPMGIISLLQKADYVIRPIDIYKKYSRKQELKWRDYENDDFKTVLPIGVDSIIKQYYYNGALGGFLSGRNARNKNVFMTPQGAIWFEYQNNRYSFNDEYGELKSSFNDFDKKLSTYINGEEDSDYPEIYDEDEVVEAAMQEELSGAVDGDKISDSLVNRMIDSVSQFVLGEEDSIGDEQKKVYPSRFVEFWSKVSDAKQENMLESMLVSDTTESETRVDTLSLGDGLGTYTATYDDDVVFEYKMPDDSGIKLRIRGDEKAMRRPELLDYFRKAVLREKE